MQAPWRIELLGELRVVHGSRVVTHFRSQKTGLLLAYLAYHLHRPHRRDQLCDWLWPDGDPSAARHSLRSVLHWLREALEPPDTPAGTLLRADRTTVQLNPAAVTTDVAEFGAALEAAARAGDSAERAQCLARAVDLYAGELLPGCYDGWVLQEREWLAERFFPALGQWIAHLEQAGDLSRALEMAKRGVRLDPLSEEVHAELMRLYAAAGQPAAALRQYEELERILKEELDATPSPATRALAQQVERQSLIRRVSLTPSPPGPDAPLAVTPFAGSARAGAHPRPLSLPSEPGENRLVTVLFADMSRSVETMRGLHPEDAAALVNRLFGAMVDAVLKYEGQVDRFLGDGVLAVFGMLQAHEDDAERAIRAALEIREAVRKLGLEVTAGINTGAVYVGAVGPERHQERTVIGPVVNLASRLQEQARPGQLLVGETTHYQSRRAFEFAPLSLALQGFPEPVRAYTVAGALSRAEKARGIEGLRAELIGRERELAQLQEALTAVESGEGRMVSLIGEAGVGKSRLVSELRRLTPPACPPPRSGEGGVPSVAEAAFSPLRFGEGSGEGLTPFWLEGRCLELNMTTGYSLFLDLLREYFGWRPEEPEGERVARLVAALQELVERGDLGAERAEEMAPLLGNLFALRSGTDWDLRLKNASPEQIRYQTLLALQELFVALARRQPLVLVLEDLHWADSLSLDLISLLMEALAQAPFLLLCVYRPEREHRCWQLVTIASRKCPERATELTLRELTPSQSHRLVQAMLGSEQLPASMTEGILQQSQGNPFFVEELVHELIDTGTLYREGESWRAQESPGGRAAGDAGGVPGSVQSVILSRVDRLEGELRRVLESASVMGRLFRRRLLEQMAAPETGIERVLWELGERGLIYQERVVPEAEYSFKHVLTQETIYGSLLRGQRAALHQQVGEAIEGLYRGELEEQYEQLAYHYERSEADEKAVEYLLKAGEKARRAYLNEEAIGYFQRVLARLEGVERAPEARLEALTGLGRIHFMLGNLDEAEAFFRRAVAVGKEMGLAPRRLARLYHYLGEVFWWQSRYAERIRIGEEGLALLGDDTECVEAALMNDLIAWGSMLLRDFERASEFTFRNRPLLRSLPYEELLMPAYVHQASAAIELEKNLSARWEWCERLEGAGRACGDWSAVANAQLHMGVWHYAYSGELSRRVSYLRMAREQFAKIGDPKGEATALMRMGRALLALGRLSEAEAASRQGVTVLEALGHKRYAQQAWRTLGIVALCRGEWEHATEAIENELRLDREAGRTGAYPIYLLGRILLAMRKRAEAVERFYQSAVLGLGSASGLAALEFAGLGLPAVVAAIEDSIEDPDERRRVCQRLREEPEVQASASSIQWEFVAAEPDRGLPLAGFGRDGLRSGDPDAWCLEHGWSWEDPLGDCSLKVSDGIEIRAANGRDLYHLNLTAPRLLRRSDGDPSADPMPAFAMQAASLPACPETPAIGGLLLWKDDRNYVYLERGRQGRFEISFGGCIADRGVTIGRGRLPCERVFLRLERVDRRLRALCSADGEVWFLVGQGEFPAADPLQVGIHAIGAVDRTIYPGAHLDGTSIRFEP